MEQVVFVGKESFIPVPEVDSEVIKLEIREQPAVKVLNEDIFFQIIKASFMQRRKTLANGLLNTGIISDKEQIYKIFEKMGLDFNIRGEKLTIDQFANLSNLICEGL